MKKVDAMLDMTRPKDGVKPPTCEHRGESLGIKRLPPPTKVLLRYRSGAEVETDFIGWDVVYAWIATDGLWALRDKHRVILTDSHWASQLWGNA